MHMRLGIPTGRLLLAVAVASLLVALGWAMAAPAAQAAPANTCGLKDLQVLLDANGGTLSGYFKTILEGDTIVDVPVHVRSIVPQMTQDGALILFDASGSQVSALGGIAHGMSGSPLFVRVDGWPDQLVGAVSYGDIFTLGDLGMATPIEYMVAIENAYLDAGAASPGIVRRAVLETRLSAGGQTIERIVVAPSTARAERVTVDKGTAVFAPLAAIQIGGLDPRTKAYQALSARLEAMGFSVVPGGSGVSGGYDPDWSTTLTGGASLAALYVRGDVWAGAAGTVTYVDGAKLLGFGHPLDWSGQTEVYLTNAWVSGIWSSAQASYKLMSPAMLRGTITQDRGSGVAGIIGVKPVDTTITSSATLGERTVTSSAAMPRSLSSGTLAWLPPAAAAVAVSKAIDAWSLAGSARTVSTVVVSDGTQDYTVVRSNLWDDSYDVSYLSTGDLDTILMTLTANPDGIAPATIKSVDFQGTYSASRFSARIVSVAVPGGLKTGVNDVQITLAVFGASALQTQHVTLVIPKGTSLRGSLEVRGIVPQSTEASVREAAGGDGRQTVADLVAELNALPVNNDIVVAYRPDSAPDGSDPAAETTASTSWVVSGSLQLPTSVLRLHASPKTVDYGRATVLSGTIELAAADTVVELYATPRGSTTRKLIATVPATASESIASFMYRVGNVRTTTRYTAVWAGDEANLGATGSVLVSMRPRVTLAAGRIALPSGSGTTLSATVLPARAGSAVTFECRGTDRRWIAIRRTTTGASGLAAIRWKPLKAGSYTLRATVAGSRSATITLTVK
jgi:hypothetical protein